MNTEIKFNLKALTLALLPLIGLAGCNSSGDSGDNSTTSGNGGNTSQVNNTGGNSDSDGDGLSDEEELTIYKTNPLVKDTDGDGYSDYDEIVLKAFNKDVNNFQFNPRIADVPKLEMEITSTPNLAMVYTEGSATRKTVGTERTSTTSKVDTKNWGGSNSQSIEMSHTASASATVGYDAGPVASVTVGYEFSYSSTNESSTNWSQEQQTENSNALAEIENKEEESSVNVEGGKVSTTITIRNNGDIAYRLKDLTLSSYMGNQADPTKVLPVGNLTYSGAGIDFPALTLSPGEKTPPLNFSGNVDIQTIKSVLANSANLVISPVIGSLQGNGDFDFELASTDINTRTAQVIIDYGTDQPVETYRVATVVDSNHPGITAKEVFADILQIPVTTGTSAWIDGKSNALIQSHQGLTKVRNRGMSSTDNSYWIVAHTYMRDNGATKVTEYHNLILDDYDFDQIKLQKGDVLHLVYVQDSDRDGLGNRAEFLYGTAPNKADTDGDGLTDAQEIVGWEIDYMGKKTLVHSNPLIVDTDGDGANDYAEWLAKTHPNARPMNRPPVVNSVTYTHDGMDVELTINASDANDNLDRLVVTWGDGVVQTFANVAAGVTKIKYEYKKLSNFNVQVTAYDKANEASKPQTVSVYAGVPKDTLMLDMAFNGNYNDAKGNVFGLDGLQGYATDRFGMGEKAIDFYANQGQADMFPLLRSNNHIDFSQDFTLALWIKAGNFYGNDVRIAGQGNWFNLYNTGGYVKFGILDGTQPKSGAPVVASNVKTGTDWELYVAMVSYDTVSHKSKVSLYRNGVLMGSKEVSGVLSNPGTCNFYVGHYVNGNQCNSGKADEFSGLNAKIDDLRLFGRALTEGEIKALYAER